MSRTHEHCNPGLVRRLLRAGRRHRRRMIVMIPAILLGIVLSVGLLLPTMHGPETVMAMTDDQQTLQPAPIETLQPAPIDGARAFQYLTQLCDFGPRPAGSEANTKQREFVAAHFEKHGGRIFEQKFTAVHPRTRERLALANLIGSWYPERTERVLICAHYDTRPHADEEFDPARYRQPFLGANDGASGVALLMEIAHHLNDLPTPWGVDLILLDAEELVYGRSGHGIGDYFLGSRAFAQAYARARRDGKISYSYHAGILLDMVGGKNMVLKREPYSVDAAPWLVNEVWDVAARLKAPAFVRSMGREVFDDHIELNKGGIPTIDLIDFDYPHWHLISDTPEQCAPESLLQVGRVVTAWLTQPISASTRPKR